MKPPTYQGELIGTFIRDVTQAIPTLTKSQVRRRLQEILDSQLTSLEEAIKKKSKIDEDEYMFVDDQDKKLAAGAYIGYTDAIKSVLNLIKSRREGL